MLEWIEKANKDVESRQEVLSFSDYMEKLEKNPTKEFRPTYEYLIDMLKHFGVNEDGSYKLFEIGNNEAPAVFGQKKVQKAIIQNLNNFQEEGFNNKFILLVGPNGSSKSSIVRKFMRGAEEYSLHDDGALYTFSWIFPIDNFVKGSLGLTSDPINMDLNSYAYLEDKDISAILDSEMKDHPLLLIPLEHRKKLIEEKLKDNPVFFEGLKKSYLYNGDLSKRNRLIYDALLKNYKGQHTEVLKHIRVERFQLSKRYSTGAVTIEPQIHQDAQMQQITMDKRLASLPPSLQSLNLFSMKGEIVMANRGLLEYSDLLKRPLDTYKYLLMTMETRNINIQGILTELDIFFVGTSNEIHLAAFKQHPDFNSFKGRFNFVRVPYLLSFKEEEKIYLNQISGLKDKSIFEPHTLKALCLFSTMTRLRCPQVKNYSDKKLANIATNLNPLEKVFFLATREAPKRLDSESRQILINGYEDISQEFESENLYEGKFGISPRDMKNIIYKISNRHKFISFVEIIDYLERLITKKNNYDFLNMTPQADYHHPARFIALIKDHCLDSFDRELRESLGMVDERSYEAYIQRYIENVMALIKGEKIKNKVTGKFEESSTYFIQEFETNIDLKENAESFRSHLISKLGAYSLDHPGKDISYVEVFPDLVNKLMESFRSEQKKMIQTISKNLVFFESMNEQSDQKESVQMSKESEALIEKVLTNLEDKYHYSKEGALSVVKQLIKERY